MIDYLLWFPAHEVLGQHVLTLMHRTVSFYARNSAKNTFVNLYLDLQAIWWWRTSSGLDLFWGRPGWHSNCTIPAWNHWTFPNRQSPYNKVLWWPLFMKHMSGSCHLNRASNVEIGVVCQIFVIVIFFNCGRVLQFGGHSRYCKGAFTQKR